MNKSNIANYCARIISGVVHPILIPLYTVFIIFHSNTILDKMGDKFMYLVYFIIVVFTMLLPLVILALLKWGKFITSYSLKVRRERVLPLLLSSISYLLGYFLLRKIPFIEVISPLLLFYPAIAISLVALISYKWKISIHLTGMGGFVAILFIWGAFVKADCRDYFMIAVLFSGLLAAARLQLNRHTPQQVYCGFLLGFLTILMWLI